MDIATPINLLIDKTTRKQIMKAIKLSHKLYLSSLDTENADLFYKRFKNLYNKIREQLSRKEICSANSLKGLPLITKIISGINDDIIRLKLSQYGFESEINLICHFARAKIEENLNTKYNGQCNYSEALLNCYLDLIISLTTRKTIKEIEAYPEFLVNPISNQNMELDVLFEGFKIAFEFQGETHYTDYKTIEKDKEKLIQCSREKIILIPINAHQLQSVKLLDLIANSIKDYLNLGVAVKKLIDKQHEGIIIYCSKSDLSNFHKVMQRIKVANLIFGSIFRDLDERSKRYVETQNRRSPVTTSTNAPRAYNSGLDCSFERIHMVIPSLNRVAKGQLPSFAKPN